MTNWLIKHFVKDWNNNANPAVRIRYGQLAGIVGIICNLLLSLAKGVIGVLSGSIAIVADAFNNLSDAASNIVSLLGFRLASKPADLEHPYGHGRYEYLSGLIVAILVAAVGLDLAQSSIQKIIHPEAIEFTPIVSIVLLLSILMKLWMMVFSRFIARRISSETLEATAVDSRNDVIATAAVLLSSIISSFTGLNLDGWAGLAVGIFIIVSSIGLIRDTIDPLLGKAPDAKFVEHIRQKILSYPGVLGTHDLMVHDYGPGRMFASAHVEMAAEVNPLESHDVLDNIEQDFKVQDGLLLTLHYDPIITDDSAVTSLRSRVAALVASIDSRCTIHDFRTISGPTHNTLIFDCTRPVDLSLSAEDLKQHISKLVREEIPKAICKITVDESYVSSQQ